MPAGQSGVTAEREPHPLHPARIGERLFQDLPVGLVVYDRRLRIVTANREARALLPAGDHLVGVLGEAVRGGAYHDWAGELQRVVDTGKAARFDSVPYHPPRGAEGYLTIICQPLGGEPGTPAPGGVLVVEDVTVHLSMEKRLAVSERMAALGKLASRVAHELNNPLDGILRYVNLALRVLGTAEADRAEHYLTETRTGLLRMVEIIGQLLEFSRSSGGSFGGGNINEVVEEAIRSYQEQAAGAGVTIVCDLYDRMPGVRGNNLYQVFCNLIKNALDAMESGGRLTVTTRLVDAQACIRFEDTGVGLPDDFERIFEAFYTTKPPGKGTGLGLAICKELIERYNGRIVAGRREGGGAVFDVLIPLDACVGAGR